MSDLTPRQRRHQQTREAILQTAITLIREEGADNLSLREIARRIDYSPAGLYEYFGSKDEIIQTVCQIADDRLATYLHRVATDQPMTDYLVALGLAYIRFARDNPGLFTLMFGHLPGPDSIPDEDDLDQVDAFSVLYQAVTNAIQAGMINTSQTAVEAAYSLWATAHGLAVLQVMYLQALPLDFAQADQHTLQALIKGLHPGASG